MLRARTACTFSTSQLPKVVRAWCVLYMFTSKRASRHNGVHFFHSSASKSHPRMTCFTTLDFQMCFAPQRRALFLNSTSKSAPRPTCFDTFDFQMCFAPQPRSIFHLSSGQLPQHPPLWRTYFSTPGATKHWKNIVFRDSPTFSRTCIFSRLTFSTFPVLACAFPSVHIVGSLASKLFLRF